MIKVLMCGNHPSNKGGMTSVIQQIREYDWASKGIKVDFIPTFLPGSPVRKALFFVFSYLCITAKMLFQKPDIVHMHMSYRGSFSRKYLLHRLCRRHRVPDIIHLHGSEFEMWYQAVSEKKQAKIRSLLREASAVIVLGEIWEATITRIEPAANVVVISNGVAIPPETVKWDDDRCRVLFLGVLIRRKGVADLLKTIGDIKNQGSIGNLHFTIAGTGEEEAELKRLAKEYAICPYVDFVGWISGSDKQRYLSQSQMMISPSYHEGLPVSILEAMSYGMPVVSTDVGDIPSVIRHKENGMLFSPGETQAMKDCILYLADRANYERVSAAARETAEQNYSLQTFISKVCHLYQSLYS